MIVGTLLIIWLLKGILYNRMCSDVLIIVCRIALLDQHLEGPVH